ncbi:MAG TPA: penicillin-binding protein 2 [Candidatus Saccharimonadales bacterium]|nr:penicillin-binding protein 2 [Candidatus Saccharimonadales bacterium]
MTDGESPLPIWTPVPGPAGPSGVARGRRGSGAGSSRGSAARRPVGQNVFRVGIVVTLAFAIVAVGAGYWQVFQASALSNAPDNPAVVAAARQIVRGVITDRTGVVLATSKKDKNGEPYRVYTDPAMSSIIGYASRQFGTAGLERAYDAQLTGSVRSNPLDELLKKFAANPYDPQTLQLSVSLALQRAAVNGLGSDLGAVVMLDPRTGKILALASTPTFNASAVANPATGAAAFAALQKNPQNPLLNRATQGLYVPGSVFKIVTAIAGLGSGAITPATTYPEQPAAEQNGLLVDGYLVRDGHHPWTDGQALDLYSATENSCNIWYALTGLKIGGAAFADWAGRLGLGRPIPFDLPTAISQVTNGGGSFGGGFKDEVELANAAYGQAEVLVTPLQMALVAATIANGGVEMQPQLVNSISSAKGGTTQVQPQVMNRVLPADLAADISKAMEQAVEGQYGRLFTTGAAVPGIPTAGKSGTAQLGGSGEPDSWFIGFAPANNPQVAIAVVVEHGGSGAIRASPLAGQLLQAYFATLKP